jgi:hypothetical protein
MEKKHCSKILNYGGFINPESMRKIPHKPILGDYFESWIEANRINPQTGKTWREQYEFDLYWWHRRYDDIIGTEHCPQCGYEYHIHIKSSRSKWVSVENELPRVRHGSHFSDVVLTVTDQGYHSCRVYNYNEKKWTGDSGDIVIYWRPFKKYKP